MLHFEQKEVIFIPHWGQSGWVGGGVGCVGIEEGFMHGHISPLKESPHCQLPTIIKQPRRVYHWLCLTSLIRQMCATYIGQQSSTAPISVPHFQMRLYRLVWLFPLLNSMKSCLHIIFKKMIVSWTVWHWEIWKVFSKANFTFFNMLCGLEHFYCHCTSTQGEFNNQNTIYAQISYEFATGIL